MSTFTPGMTRTAGVDAHDCPLGEAQSGAQQLTQVVGRCVALRRIDELVGVGLLEAHLGERPVRLVSKVDGGGVQSLAIGRAVCMPERQPAVGVAFDAQRSGVDGSMVGSTQRRESSWVMTAAFASRI